MLSYQFGLWNNFLTLSWPFDSTSSLNYLPSFLDPSHCMFVPRETETPLERFEGLLCCRGRLMHTTFPRIFDALGCPLSSPTCDPAGSATGPRAHPRLFEQFTPSAFVSGAGHFVPPDVVTNLDLANRYGLRFPDRTTAEAEEFAADIVGRTGILERCHAHAGPTLAEIAAAAARRAIEAAEISIDAVSHIVIGTTYLGLSDASFAEQIRHHLANREIAVEILPYACASAGYCAQRALDILATVPESRHVVIVGADKGSSFINFTDPGTAILFGDGAGALVISRRQAGAAGGSGILTTVRHELPQFGELIYLNAAGKIEMPNGKRVFQQACKAVKQCVTELLTQAQLVPADADRLILHQANMRLPSYIAETLQLEPEKVPTNIQHYGNTCAASPLILASEASRFGLLRKGDLVILGAVGLGMRASAVLLIW